MNALKSLAAAKFILARCQAKGCALTPMQLIKLVYIAHGYMLGKKGQPLLLEPVEAWEYGPVVPSVYRAVRAYKSSPVAYIAGAPADFAFSEDEMAIMTAVADAYRHYSGITLSAATHQPGTPWQRTRAMSGRNAPISNDLLESFYAKLILQPKHSAL